MIATFLTEVNGGPGGPHVQVHAVLQVGREGLKVKAHGYCGAVSNAADGTFQIPEWAFDGQRQMYQPMGSLPGWQTGWRVCPQCAATLKRLREPPR